VSLPSKFKTVLKTLNKNSMFVSKFVGKKSSRKGYWKKIRGALTFPQYKEIRSLFYALLLLKNFLATFLRDSKSASNSAYTCFTV
jgi:hypothetical protein